MGQAISRSAAVFVRPVILSGGRTSLREVRAQSKDPYSGKGRQRAASVFLAYDALAAVDIRAAQSYGSFDSSRPVASEWKDFAQDDTGGCSAMRQVIQNNAVIATTDSCTWMIRASGPSRNSG